MKRIIPKLEKYQIEYLIDDFYYLLINATFIGEITNNFETIYQYKNNEYMIDIYIQDNKILIKKYNDLELFVTEIADNMVILRVFEKRLKGLLYKEIIKKYNYNKKYNKMVLTELNETRRVYSKDVISNFNANLIDIINNLPSYIKNFSLVNTFSTVSNDVYNNDEYMNVTRVNKYSNQTFLNNIDVSFIYDMVDGHDKIYRIYELFNGQISPRSEIDLHSIYLGMLTSLSFNLSLLSGIKEQENMLIGESLQSNLAYNNYIDEIFDTKYHIDNFSQTLNLSKIDIFNKKDDLFKLLITNYYSLDAFIYNALSVTDKLILINKYLIDITNRTDVFKEFETVNEEQVNSYKENPYKRVKRAIK